MDMRGGGGGGNDGTKGRKLLLDMFHAVGGMAPCHILWLGTTSDIWYGTYFVIFPQFNIFPRSSAPCFTYHYFPISFKLFLPVALTTDVCLSLSAPSFSCLRVKFSVNWLLHYVSNVTWLSEDKRVLGWWLDSLGNFTARDYISEITIHRLVFLVTLLGSGFQRHTFLCFRAHVLTPTAYSDRWL
jgi:hypothetical protein